MIGERAYRNEHVEAARERESARAETHYYRLGLLKKYVSDVLFLRTLRVQRDYVYRNFVAAFGAATILFGLSRNFALSLALLALLGAADMVSVFIRSTLVQLNTPDAVRGRVSAISGLAISASNELGEMQSGVAAGLLGATGAVVFGGAGAIMVVVIWAWLFPELRNARTFAPHYRQSHRQKEPAP